MQQNTTLRRQTLTLPLKDVVYGMLVRPNIAESSRVTNNRHHDNKSDGLEQQYHNCLAVTFATHTYTRYTHLQILACTQNCCCSLYTDVSCPVLHRDSCCLSCFNQLRCNQVKVARVTSASSRARPVSWWYFRLKLSRGCPSYRVLLHPSSPCLLGVCIRLQCMLKDVALWNFLPANARPYSAPTVCLFAGQLPKCCWHVLSAVLPEQSPLL